MSQLRKPRLKLGSTSNSIYLDTSENNKLIIKNEDVDIIEFSGITTNSTLKIKSTDPSFEIYGTEGYTKIALNVSGKDGWKITSGYEDGTDNENNIHIRKGSGTDILSIHENGIGINVTKSSYALDVSGDAIFRNRMNVQGALVLGGGLDTDEISPIIWFVDNTGQYFYTMPSANGGVGIGITTPQYKLEVNGDFGVSGNINSNTDALYDIGTTSNKFNNLYINNLNVSGINIFNDNNKINISSNTKINGNLDIEGDLNVFGNAVSFDTETIQVEDSMISLANNNTSDIIDSGFYTQYVDNNITKFTGLIRDASTGSYNLFTNLEIEPTNTVDINTTSFEYADLKVNDLNINGSLGIGTDNPINAKLEINGNDGSVALNAYSYNRIGSNIVELGTTVINSYSIYADGKIAASEFNAISDKRVKKNIINRDVKKDIDFINNINIYKYNFIDEITSGSNEKIGFIAQEIQELNENIINHSSKYIPNIYKNYKLLSENKIIIDDDIKLNLNDNLKIQIFNLDINKYSFIETKIINISENIYTYDNKNINIDITKDIFIYGKLINDFLTIDTNQILAINTNMIKFLYNKIINDDKKYKNEIDNILERLENIEKNNTK